MVRTAAAIVLVSGMLVACGQPSAAVRPSPDPTACATGYSVNSQFVHLSNGDNGRHIEAHLCTVISVVLNGSDAVQWVSVESSNSAVLAIVPLPLPHPPNGGIEAVYLAKRTSSATLTASGGPAIACPPNAMCMPLPRWTVSVIVTP